MADGKDFDLVVFGASGFTGKLVCEYLLGQKDVRWAMGGRSENKLKATRDELGEACKDVPIVVANSDDAASLVEMVNKTKVVLTTVGPYMKYGAKLVEVCAAAGVHYCDLTGEPSFMKQTAERHHQVAIKSGAKIVCACGYDSIPSDIGALMVVEHMHEKLQTKCAQLRYFCGKVSGGVSGGTLDSAFTMFENPALLKDMVDPYVYAPGIEESKRNDGTDPALPIYDSNLKSWASIFVMGPTNTRVVRRSFFLTNYEYGDRFSYYEYMKVPNIFVALAITVGLGIFGMLMVFPPTRWLLKWLLPKPGEGPSLKQRQTGSFNTTLIGIPEDPDAKELVVGKVGSKKGDPGYQETAKMVAESAMCLAFDGDKVKKRHSKFPVAGVLTPATAMGLVLMERLRKAGMDFEATVQTK